MLEHNRDQTRTRSNRSAKRPGYLGNDLRCMFARDGLHRQVWCRNPCIHAVGSTSYSTCTFPRYRQEPASGRRVVTGGSRSVEGRRMPHPDVQTRHDLGRRLVQGSSGHSTNVEHGDTKYGRFQSSRKDVRERRRRLGTPGRSICVWQSTSRHPYHCLPPCRTDRRTPEVILPTKFGLGPLGAA